MYIKYLIHIIIYNRCWYIVYIKFEFDLKYKYRTMFWNTRKMVLNRNQQPHFYPKIIDTTVKKKEIDVLHNNNILASTLGNEVF